MHSWQTRAEILPPLIALLARDHRVVAPVQGDDGLVRLQRVAENTPLACGARPLLSLKKYLLPPGGELWRYAEAGFVEDEPPRPLAAVALPPCDLQAVAYLDQVLEHDSDYRRRRSGLVLVGARCTPADDCRCLAPLHALPADLFVADGRVWALSAAGEALAAELAPLLDEPDERPLPDDVLPHPATLPEDLEVKLAALAGDPLWDRPAATCLACGACSSVCPTCYCFDLREHALPGGEPWRERDWDNCLFDDFAVVAGGHDFRPGYRSRLQFRMRHKLLGFGALSGTPSCVGCSRCRQHCPVDIGPQELLDRLTAGGDA